MSAQTLIGLVGSYGYLALFCCLFLGIVGLPVNDETLVMLAGFVAARRILSPLPAFLVTYAGVLSGMNIGFVLGRSVGGRLLTWWCGRSLRRQRMVEKVRTWLDQRGVPFILVTYYIPGVRHVVPYLIGVGKMPYWRFAAIAFTGGLAWTAVFYTLGYTVGEHWEKLAAALHHYGLIAGAVLLAGAGLVWLWQRRPRST